MQDVLLVDVLNENVKGFGGAVDFLVELEVGRDRKLDAQHGSCDRLHVCRRLDL